MEDKLEATREQRLAKGKRSHETSLERKLYEELQKLREHCAQHCGHDLCEIGCTRQFFTKSFLGDDAADLARSSGEEPAWPRHRAGVASMAWRTTR